MIVHKTSPTSASCPPWCVQTHDSDEPDQGQVHIGEPLHLSDGVTARLCMSVDARGQVEDGPYVLVGEEEYTLEEVSALGAALITMAAGAARAASAASREKSANPGPAGGVPPTLPG